MTNQSTSGKQGNRGWLKMVVLFLVIGAIGVYAWQTYDHYAGGLERDPELSGERGPGPGPRREGPPPPEERREHMNRMMDQANFSADQRAQVEAIMAGPEPKSREEMRARFEAIREIATPEQQEAMRQQFMRGGAQRMQRMREHLGERLSPEDAAALEKRMQQRMQQRQQGGGGRGPGGPGGPGGQGGP